MLQLAFQYSILVPCDDGARQSSADGNYRNKSAVFSRYQFGQSIKCIAGNMTIVQVNCQQAYDCISLTLHMVTLSCSLNQIKTEKC